MVSKSLSFKVFSSIHLSELGSFQHTFYLEEAFCNLVVVTDDQRIRYNSVTNHSTI